MGNEKMRVFLQVWCVLLRLGLAWCDSCLLADISSFVCKEIPDSYPPGLTSLVLWVSNLGEINATVFNYTNLASVSSLSLRNTGITAISPGAFDKFQNLKTLDLYNNQISHVTSAWFYHKEVLEHLNLSNNSIAVLSKDAFHGLSGLLGLNLSHNQLHTIPTDSLHSLVNLRHLDLCNNKLSHLNVETLLLLNSTKICLSGNPWNCSYTEFTAHMRELERASLLENKMEVVCDSPACLRGAPVWNVSKCTEPSMSVDPTVGYNLTLPHTPVERQMNWPVLVSLIVVLCALVLVICVLSVLYHRKRERRHLQTIQPSPGEPGRGKQVRTVCRRAQENVEASILDLKKKKPNNKSQVLLKLDQSVCENVSENESKIFQIYGSGIYQSREIGNRAKSAGPVLSRTGTFGEPVQAEVKEQQHLAEKEVKGGRFAKHEWVKMEKQHREDEGGNDGKLLSARIETNKDDRINGRDKLCLHRVERNQPLVDVVGDNDTRLETQEKLNANQAEEEYILKDCTLMEGTLKDSTLRAHNLMESSLAEHTQDLQQSGHSDITEDTKDYLSSSFRRHEPSQLANDLALEDSENIPYLTIGTNVKNQHPKPEHIPTESTTKRVPSKPIRRVLTWPPTAVQWKKQWTQNRQDLTAFPKLIYVTGCKHQIGMFPFNTTSGSPEHLPQLLLSSSVPQGSGSVPEQRKTVEPLKQICESSIRSYIQDLPNLAQYYEEVIEEVQSRIIHPNPPTNSDESYSPNDLVHKSPLFKASPSKTDGIKESMNASEDSKNAKRSFKGKVTDQTVTSKPVGSKSEKQSRIRETEKKKTFKEEQKDQSGSDLRVPLSRGSPSDDNLLVNNEYAFIDLLHEVVENHGRWTRERWRQSHLNKQKQKQTGVAFPKRF